MISGPPVMTLVRDVEWPAGVLIGGSALSGDGGTLVVTQVGPALDVTTAVVSFWPEVLALATLIAVLAAARKWVRASRHPQRDGGLYCRKCGYDLSGMDASATGAACSECGLPSARMKGVYGRSAGRRVAWPLGVACVLLAGTACVYGLGWRGAAAGLPLPVVTSRGLYETAKGINLRWAQRYRAVLTDVVVVDLRSAGSKPVTLTTLRGDGGIPVFAPDGTTVLVSVRAKRAGELVALDTQTKSTRGRLALSGGIGDAGGVIGFLEGDALVVIGDANRDVTEVLRWDMRSDRGKTLIQEGGSNPWVGGRREERASGDGKVVVTTYRDMAMMQVNVYDVTVTPARKLPELSVSTARQVMAAAAWELNGDGSEANIANRQEIAAINLASGEKRVIRKQGAYAASSTDRLSGAGYPVVERDGGGEVACCIYHRLTGVLVARVAMPPGYGIPEVWLSTQRRVGITDTASGRARTWVYEAAGE